jgi:hypothetical protein
MSVLFASDARFWWSGLGAGKSRFGALRTDMAKLFFSAHGTTPFFHLSVLFKTGAPLLVVGLGAGKITFGSARADIATTKSRAHGATPFVSHVGSV